MSESTSFVDYYKLLGVAPDAEPAGIKRAFLRLAAEHHPDVGGSTEVMQQLTAAYRTLMSEKSRKSYDLLHDFHVGHSEVKYREAGSGARAKSVNDLSDDEIDDFLDQLYQEYAYKPKPRKTLLTKLKSLL